MVSHSMRQMLRAPVEGQLADPPLMTTVHRQLCFVKKTLQMSPAHTETVEKLDRFRLKSSHSNEQA